MISDILKGKSDEEIEKLLLDLPGEQIIEAGAKMGNYSIVKYGIEKTGTKIWALDYNPSSSSFFDNMINLKSLYELVGFDEDERFIKLINIMKDDQDDHSFIFFGERFSPIYKENKHIAIMTYVLNEVNEKTGTEK